jgi:WS/DGAT/MGAT family acyltransferase
MEHDGAPEQMSGFEALMWQLERSPLLSNAFTNLTILDRPPNRAALRSRMMRATQRVPKLRQVAEPSPNPLGRPIWVTDPEFDLDHHLRWVNLGGEASDEDLNAYVSDFSGQPFDRGRPLWDFVLIEGLASGKSAMAQRMHHTITDGEGGIKLSIEFLDMERDAGIQLVEPDPVASPADPRSSSDPEGYGDHELSGDAPDLPAGGRSDWRSSIGESLRSAPGQVGSAFSKAAGSIMDPAGSLRSTAGQIPTSRRMSPLWTQRSTDRWFGRIEVDLAEVKSAAHALGGSVNDLFVTGATDGAGRYHRDRGADVEELRMSMPVSTRRDSGTDDRPGGNSFSPTTTFVPTAEMPPEERFRLVSEKLSEVKESTGGGGGSLDSVASVMNLLPSAALAAAGERITGAVDFVCSNVRAAPFDLYIGGALIEGNYPLGPLAGTAFNLTTMSYRGKLFIGLVADTEAVSEPQSLLDVIEHSFEELLAFA